jgi:hypothetical protein
MISKGDKEFDEFKIVYEAGKMKD